MERSSFPQTILIRSVRRPMETSRQVLSELTSPLEIFSKQSSILELHLIILTRMVIQAGSLSSHSFLGIDSAALNEELAIRSKLFLIWSIISYRQTSTFPTNYRSPQNLTSSQPTQDMISVAFGLISGFGSSTSVSFSIAQKILLICLLILSGEFPLERISSKSLTETK